VTGVRIDHEAWRAAGGEVDRLALYASIGRVAPVTDGEHRCLATIHPALPGVGAIGDWTGGDRVREAAEAWLSAEGCRLARGPLELCTWFRYRASLGPHDDPPFALEPTEPAARWIAAGYHIAATYTSAVASSRPMIEAGVEPGRRLVEAGWCVETLPRGGDGLVPEPDYRAAVSLVHRITTASFSRAYGYAPIPEGALQAWYAPWRPFVDPRLTLLARAPDGEIGGFLFAIPDVARPDRGWALIKTLAVLPAHRQLGVGSWLSSVSHDTIERSGYSAAVHCLMWSSSRSQDISRYGARVFRRYALLEKEL